MWPKKTHKNKKTNNQPANFSSWETTDTKRNCEDIGGIWKWCQKWTVLFPWWFPRDFLSLHPASISLSVFLSQHFFFPEFLGKKIDVSHVSELGETFLHWHWMTTCDMSYPPSLCSIHSGPITSAFIFSTSPAHLASAMLASKCTKSVPASGPLHQLFFLYQPSSPKSLHPLPPF